MINLICKSDYSALDSAYVVVLAMIAIFLVLFFLMIIMILSPMAIKWLEDKRNKPKNEQITPQIQPATQPIAQNESHDEQEQIAAITVAITALRQNNGERAPFIIKKIKRNKEN